MKRTIVLTLVALSSLVTVIAQEKKSDAGQTEKPKSSAPAKITTAEAEKYVGKEAIVTGKVTRVRQTEKITQINFGPAYPNQDFTAVLFSRATNQFTDVNFTKLTGKTVEVRGHVEDYNGKPQIVVNTKQQLKVLDEADKPKESKPDESKPATEEKVK
ncbi:MAG: hypothetical protein EPO07_19720 [Verrucomicrobia bacterium]|nr:MAG: hypothetical protein EPO07_19720 [Verrucomicrobiota bacterium]